MGRIRIAAILILPLLAVLHAAEDNKSDEKKFFNDEHRLLTNMFKDYDTAIRPAKYQNQSVVVHLGFAAINLVRVDERFSQLSIHTWVRMRWVDERLAWDPKNYSSIAITRVPPSKLWKPDIHLYNSAWGWGSLSGGSSYSAVVSSGGDVLYIPAKYISAYCDLNLKRFPYDKHSCPLKFGSWAYDGNLLDLQFFGGNEGMDFNDYSPHDEWDVVNSSAKRSVKYYPCCPEPYPDITFNITLARKSGQYVHIFIIPTVVLSSLIPFAFLLSPLTGEKTYLCLGLILAFTLQTILLEDSFPSSEGSAPYIVQYYASCFVMTAIVLIISQLLSFLWRARISKPPPRIIDTLIIGCLGKIFCVNKDNYGELEEFTPEDANIDTPDTVKIHAQQKPAAMMDWKLISTIISRLMFFFFIAVIILMDVVMLNY